MKRVDEKSPALLPEDVVVVVKDKDADDAPPAKKTRVAAVASAEQKHGEKEEEEEPVVVVVGSEKSQGETKKTPQMGTQSKEKNDGTKVQTTLVLPDAVRRQLERAWPAQRPRAPPHLHGWFLDTHRRVFDAVLDPQNTRIVLELGSWYGASTKWLAEKCPRAMVYAVDFWDDAFIVDEQADHYETMGRRKLRTMLDRHPLWDTFRTNLWDLRDRIVPLRMSTVEGIEFLAKHRVSPDVVYVDADHHYDACKRDLTRCIAAFPRAVLVGDDYGHYDDVRRAVTEVAQQFGKEIHVDANHCWAYARVDSITGRNFRPPPPATSSFASLLDDFAKS